jgi:hypothetical protein
VSDSLQIIQTIEDELANEKKKIIRSKKKIEELEASKNSYQSSLASQKILSESYYQEVLKMESKVKDE